MATTSSNVFEPSRPVSKRIWFADAAFCAWFGHTIEIDPQSFSAPPCSEHQKHRLDRRRRMPFFDRRSTTPAAKHLAEEGGFRVRYGLRVAPVCALLIALKGRQYPLRLANIFSLRMAGPQPEGHRDVRLEVYANHQAEFPFFHRGITSQKVQGACSFLQTHPNRPISPSTAALRLPNPRLHRNDERARWPVFLCLENP